MVDLIDRQQAIDALNMQAEEMSYWSERYQEQRRGILTAVNIIVDCPSVQPERKVGKWIKDKSWSEGAGMGESYGHYWKCNQCNNIVKGDWSQCRDNFCSECGADMRGEAK